MGASVLLIVSRKRRGLGHSHKNIIPYSICCGLCLCPRTYTNGLRNHSWVISKQLDHYSSVRTNQPSKRMRYMGSVWRYAWRFMQTAALEVDDRDGVGLWKCRFLGHISLSVTVPIAQSIFIFSSRSDSSKIWAQLDLFNSILIIYNRRLVAEKDDFGGLCSKNSSFTPHEYVDFGSYYLGNIFLFAWFSVSKAWVWTGFFGSLNIIIIFRQVMVADWFVGLGLWKPR